MCKQGANAPCALQGQVAEEGAEATSPEGKVNRLHAIDALLAAMKRRLRKVEASIRQVSACPACRGVSTSPACRSTRPAPPTCRDVLSGHLIHVQLCPWSPARQPHVPAQPLCGGRDTAAQGGSMVRG